MTPSELKYNIGLTGKPPYYFTRKTMSFFGDTMANYGCCSAIIEQGGETIECWELWRKRPVKHGLNSSKFFRKDNFRVVITND